MLDANQLARGDMAFMRRIVAKAILAEEARQYFIKHKEWEGRMRTAFGNLQSALRHDWRGAIGPAVRCLRDLDRNYQTQAARQRCDFDMFATIIIRVIREHDWIQEAPGRIFEEPPARVSDAVFGAIPEILDAMKQAGQHRHHSLLTKFLHFTYPDTFPIYDSRAAKSIQEWSRREHLEPQVRRQFSFSRLSNTSGTGYAHLVNFYNLFWEVASSEERQRLDGVASEFTHTVGAIVSKLDVVDKLLWGADGNPVKLGLID